MQCCVPVNIHGGVGMFMARTGLHTDRCVCGGKSSHGDIGEHSVHVYNQFTRGGKACVYTSISTVIQLQRDRAVRGTCNNRSVSEQGVERGRGILVRESPCHHPLSACGFPLPGQALTCSDLMCSDV